MAMPRVCVEVEVDVVTTGTCDRHGQRGAFRGALFVHDNDGATCHSTVTPDDATTPALGTQVVVRLTPADPGGKVHVHYAPDWASAADFLRGWSLVSAVITATITEEPVRL